MELLSPMMRKNSSVLTMSSREIAELMSLNLKDLLNKSEWFSPLMAGDMSIKDAGILAFCLSKEIQRMAKETYKLVLDTTIQQGCERCCEVANGLGVLRNIASSAAHWFKNYSYLSESFSILSENLGNIDTGLIMITSPVIDSLNNKSCTPKTYIVYNPKSDQIKIGKSISPQHRIRTLETQAGSEFDVLAIIDSNREFELHKKFQKYRTVGEWFNDEDGEIRKFAKTLN